MKDTVVACPTSPGSQTASCLHPSTAARSAVIKAPDCTPCASSWVEAGSASIIAAYDGHVHDDEVILGRRYRLARRLDCGTLADIRLAEDMLLQRHVAVKLAREGDWQTNRGWYPPGVFKREAQMAAALQHPHLHAIYDFGTDGQQLQYLVMRTFSQTLRQYLDSLAPPRQLPLDVALPLFVRIADAMDYLHQRASIVHGNLKPNNILLDTELGSHLYPFVSDFGVAAWGPQGIGTPLYMAPEQAAGEAISGATDRYALGLILYECLTGTLPFRKDETITTTLFKKIRPAEGQYSVRPVRPDLPAGVDLVIDGLTRPDPSERYSTASAAIEALARVFYAGPSRESDFEGSLFISYARARQPYVHALAQRLRSIGVKVWIDRDISVGEPWDSSIEQALDDASAMLVILCPDAVQSDSVRDEWSYFLDRHKPVYPLVYETCNIPFRLRRRQHIRIGADILADASRILDALARNTGA